MEDEMSIAPEPAASPRAAVSHLCASQVQVLARVSQQFAELMDEVESSLAGNRDAVEQLEVVWRSVVEEQPPLAHEAVRPLLELLLSRFDETGEDSVSFCDDAVAAIEAINQTGVVTVGEGLRRFQEHERLAADLARRVQSVRQQFEEHWPALDADRIKASRRYFAQGGVGLSLEEMLHDVST